MSVLSACVCVSHCVCQPFELYPSVFSSSSLCALVSRSSRKKESREEEYYPPCVFVLMTSSSFRRPIQSGVYVFTGEEKGWKDSFLMIGSSWITSSFPLFSFSFSSSSSCSQSRYFCSWLLSHHVCVRYCKHWHSFVLPLSMRVCLCGFSPSLFIGCVHSNHALAFDFTLSVTKIAPPPPSIQNEP